LPEKPKPELKPEDYVEAVKGLPVSPEVERFVLGAILVDSEAFYAQAASVLTVDDFSLEKHRRIFRRMADLSARNEYIDRVTVATELDKHRGELQSIDGLSYLVSLDDGLPAVPNIASYVDILKQKSKLRRIIHICQHGMNRAFAAEDSPKDIASDLDDKLLSLQPEDASEVITPQGIIESYPGGPDEFMDPSKHEIGLLTGLTQFDEMTAGLQQGDLIIIAARPSVGKTSLALSIAEHVAVKLKTRTVLFSMEMSRVQNLRRMICSLARVDFKRFRMGLLDQHERQKCAVARNRIVESPLLIDDTATLTLMGMRAKLKKIAKKYGPVGLVIADYLQLMSSTGRQENRNQEVSVHSRGLKLIAKELGIPMVVLSQLSRAVETRKGDHRPQLSDLRESGAIEQDADLVAFIFREWLYDKKRDELKGVAELIVAKQRSGEVGTCRVAFSPPLMRFDNLLEEYDMEHGS
jgi:replicative DNA helicase